MKAKNKIAGFFDSQKHWVFVSQLVEMIGAVIFGKLVAVYIAPEIFGQYSLVLGVEAFFSSLLLRPVNQSFQYALQTGEKDVVFSYYLKKMLLLTGIAVVFYFFASFFGFFLKRYILLLVAISYFSIHFRMFLGYLNLAFKFKSYALLQILGSLLLPVLFFILVIVFGYRSVEALMVVFGGSFVIGFLVEGLVVRENYFRLLLAKVPEVKCKWFRKEMFAYIKPMVFLAVFGWISNYADRYLIEYFLDAKEVGYYAAGYSLGTKFFISFVTPFLLLLRPVIFQMKKDEEAPAKGIDITISHLKPFLGIGVVVLLGFVLGYDFIGRLFLSANYQSGFVVIPVIAGAFFLLTASYFFEVSFYAWSKTVYILYANVVGAIVNIVFNIFLIPVLGITGAAWSSLLSYGVQLAVVLFFYFYVFLKKS